MSDSLHCSFVESCTFDTKTSAAYSFKFWNVFDFGCCIGVCFCIISTIKLTYKSPCVFLCFLIVKRCKSRLKCIAFFVVVCGYVPFASSISFWMLVKMPKSERDRSLRRRVILLYVECSADIDAGSCCVLKMALWVAHALQNTKYVVQSSSTSC